ncbi:MAG TPA: hypothetical protein VFG07_03030 [Thermoplasmata archaeon]|nr:hypothetical protein [Thermoplasmata archaeon]
MKRRPWGRSTVLVVVLVAGLMAESVMGWTSTQSPALTVRIGVAGNVTNGATVTAALTSHRPFPMNIHVAAVPGTLPLTSGSALLLADPTYPSVFGSYSDTLALGDRANTLLREAGSGTTITDVSSAGLADALAANPNGTLIIAEYGVLPPSVLSPNVSLLGNWIRAGGALIWAGGPLGFYQEAPGNGSRACCPGGEGWAGQTSLIGFPLTDPVSGGGPLNVPGTGPPLGTIATPLDSAFGFEYNGTLYGANVSRLASHGGFSLGYESAAPNAAGQPSPRTSLAYLPLGAGAVYYFGGGIWTPYGQYTPLGGLALSVDIARLVATRFVPLLGPTLVQSVTLPPEETTTVELSVALGTPFVIVIDCASNDVPLWGYAGPAPSLPIAFPIGHGLPLPTHT